MWRKVLAQKKKEHREKIALFVDQHLNNFQLTDSLKSSILNSSVEGLKKLLASGEVTVV
jgi:hypothetical protein